MSKIETPSGIPEDEFLREGLVDRLTQYLEAQPDAWHMRYNLGVAYMHSGQVDEAVQAFQQVLAQAPKHMESLINLGGIFLSRGQADEALKAFTKALSVHDFPLVRANLAVAYMQLGHLEEAETQLRRALEGGQPMPDAWANLGSLLLQTDRLEESVEASHKALEVRPDFAIAHNNLAVAYLDLGQDEKAKEHAESAVKYGYPVHEDLLAKLGLK
jgi:tetratricopeptide (TPR) repeat protein